MYKSLFETKTILWPLEGFRLLEVLYYKFMRESLALSTYSISIGTTNKKIIKCGADIKVVFSYAPKLYFLFILPNL